MMNCYRFPKSFITAAIILFVGLFFVAQAIAEMRIFELQHRSAAELAEMVRGFVGEDARVTAHRNKLLVNASAAELDAVAELVVAYDRIQSMLRVTVEQGNLLDDRNRGVSGSGRLQGGTVVVGQNGPGRVDGGSIFVTSGDSRVNVRAQDTRRLEDRQVSQFMVVMEGSPARISVGKSVPFTSQMRRYCRQNPTYVESIDYRNVDTGFEVLPEVYGETVQLEIRPFMAFLNPRNTKEIVFHELTTRVRLPLGSWYDLGGQMSTKDGLSREILGFGSQSASRGNAIRVRVDLEN